MECPKCHAENNDASRFCSSCAAPLGAGAGPEVASFTKTLETHLRVLKPGTLIAGKFRIIEEIGAGGMGVVYKAEDLKLKRCLALKFLPPHLMDEPDLKERFLIEAQAAASLSHPNICVIHEVGESEDRPYIAMEYVQGETLRDRVRKGPLEPGEAVGLVDQVAAGLGEAHAKGIVHRDVKSANIMVTAKGRAKVMDFGLAKLRPGLAPELDHVVLQALTKKAVDRYRTMEELREDLAAIAEGLKPLKAKPRPSEPERSIAVLPFINDSPDQENTYFINGVMEEILGNLQKIKALRVISRTSVEQYRERKKSIREIAEELGVNYIVEGSAQKYGNAFRLRAQLIAAERESHLWGESFQQKITDVEDIFNIQIRIAKSMEFLTSGVAKNPGWAPLYAGLAEAWLWIQQNEYEQPSVTAPKIIENMNKALALDPDLAEAHYLSAMIAHLVDWDWEKSEKEFLKALAINPNDALSRGLYAHLLLILHRKDEALAQNELALSLDPLNPMVKLTNIGTLLQAGEYQTSLSLAEEAVADDPDNLNLNQMIEIAAYRLKQYDKVLRAVRHVLPFPLEEDAYKDIERIYSESGIVSAYEMIVERLEKYAKSQPVGFWDMAFRYLVADQPDKSMDWVEKGFEMHDPLMTYITTPARYFDTLFGNPRFIAICEKMKLPLPV